MTCHTASYSKFVLKSGNPSFLKKLILHWRSLALMTVLFHATMHIAACLVTHAANSSEPAGKITPTKLTSLETPTELSKSNKGLIPTPSTNATTAKTAPSSGSHSSSKPSVPMVYSLPTLLPPNQFLKFPQASPVPSSSTGSKPTPKTQPSSPASLPISSGMNASLNSSLSSSLSGSSTGTEIKFGKLEQPNELSPSR